MREVKNKIKIGKGYYQAGYGRGFNKRPTVWLINNKAYVKDASALPFQTDIKGHVMVNQFNGVDGTVQFVEVGLIDKHREYDFGVL